MRRVRWGVIGTADVAWGRTIPAMAMAKNCELYAIAGRSREKTDKFQRKFGFEKSYESYEDLIADPQIEAVYIPLVNHVHKEWVLKAAAKGKHILCEKPLALTFADAEEMIAACKQFHVILMEAYAFLHSPATIAVKNALDSGVIGTPKLIESSFFVPPYAPDNMMYRKESFGGSLYGLGCYNISQIRYLYGQHPTSVMAMAHKTSTEVDDFTSAYLEFPNGKKASALCGMCGAGIKTSRYFIYGTEGMIEAPLFYNQAGEQKYYVINANGKESFSVFAPNNYMLEFEQMGRCILFGEQPLVSLEFSLGNARVMDQVLCCIHY